jgi:hypothetical protein
MDGYFAVMGELDGISRQIGEYLAQPARITLQ